ncbi:hypothetical protein [Amycolatopsis sp. NPDC004378]
MTDALTLLTTMADHTVDCVVARPDPRQASTDIVAGICRVWAALRRVVTPAAATLLVLGDRQWRHGGLAPLRWRVAAALQGQGWTVRNALIGPAVAGDSSNALGFMLVARPYYHFDIAAVRRKYGRNPGDVIHSGVDSIVDRFVTAARPVGGCVVELLERDPSAARTA